MGEINKNNKFNLPNLGFGAGLRSKHYDYVIENRPDIDWFEIISENYMDSAGRPRQMLDKIRENYPIVMHGVSLSIGSSDPLNMDYLKRLKKLADDINPPWISDHLCWTGINKKNSHDLLPVPLTEEALDHIIPRIQQVQDFLERPILLENPSSYLTYRADEIPEYEFIARMAEAADCALLLDINNIYVASFNQRLDPHKYIDAIPFERVVQIHMAGHEHKGTHIVDTHEGPIIDEVWDLYKYAIARAGFTPTTMVEWDTNIPDFPVLLDEVNKLREFAGQEAVKNEYHNTEYQYQKSNHSLLDLQENLQTAILDGDIVKAEPETWIVEKENFPPAEQLAVYVKGYRLRLYDILMADYEVTRRFLGKEKMRDIVKAYIEEVPSEFYNVEVFSAQFAGWLAGQGVDGFAIELADLEKEVARCFNLPGSEALEQSDLADVAPEEFLEMSLALRDSTILLEYNNDVNEYMSAFYREEELSANNKPTHLVIYRGENKVMRLPLEHEEFRLLELIKSGKSIGAAMEELAGESELSEEELSAKIQEWFGRFVANGILKKPGSKQIRMAASSG